VADRFIGNQVRPAEQGPCFDLQALSVFALRAVLQVPTWLAVTQNPLGGWQV
jgi:hypothetical protein